MSRDDITRQAALYRVVSGALKSAIAAHPETVLLGSALSSVTKRVVSQILADWDRLHDTPNV